MVHWIMHWKKILCSAEWGRECKAGILLISPHLPAVVHLHGAMVSSHYDGHPDAWHTSDKFGYVGMAFENSTHEYINEQDATGLWYHDHTMGITRLTVFAGLAGMYIIRDTAGAEQHLTGLPQGTEEVPLVLDDKLFFPDGALKYPGIGDNPENHPEWMPEFFGEHILVNGKVGIHQLLTARAYSASPRSRSTTAPLCSCLSLVSISGYSPERPVM